MKIVIDIPDVYFEDAIKEVIKKSIREVIHNERTIMDRIISDEVSSLIKKHSQEEITQIYDIGFKEGVDKSMKIKQT